MIHRRAFLRALAIGTVATAAGVSPLQLLAQMGDPDPERTLWVPGRVLFHDLWTPTPEWVTRETLRVLLDNLKFSSAINRSYADQFFGRAVNVRLPQRFNPPTGSRLIARGEYRVPLHFTT